MAHAPSAAATFKKTLPRNPRRRARSLPVVPFSTRQLGRHLFSQRALVRSDQPPVPELWTFWSFTPPPTLFFAADFFLPWEAAYAAAAVAGV